ncbi:MAG: NADH-dependent [FeFe] hydrogenase, group A6 [Evtepia sp.]
MIHLTINGIDCQAEEGNTILQAAQRNGIQIPTLCHLENIHQFGTCRICVVEQEGAKNLQASCMLAAQEGMVIHTHSDRVRRARKTLFQLLISDHNKNCLSCARNQDCELQALGRELGVITDPYAGETNLGSVDISESITRDNTKCVLCRRCVTVCNEIQGVSVLNAQNRGFRTMIAPAANMRLGETNCTYCGQCVSVCPVGALVETSHKERVWDALEDPTKYVVVQTAPAVRVGLGECFELEPGTSQTGRMVSALRLMGFDNVFDTNWAADLTIMEEGTEFLNRFKTVLDGGNAVLPMMTSCSPGWVKYIENHFPDQLDHLSTCKSPHTMMGAVIKRYYAPKIQKEAKEMYVVSVMPCTAKKTEIARAEMQNDGVPNVDAVLTTRELGEMIRSSGIDFFNLPEGRFDHPLGLSTGAADIFGLTGGVTEAALRTVYELLTGRELPFPDLHVTPLVGLQEIKEATIKLENVKPEWAAAEGFELRVAVTSGLSGAKKLMEQIKAGKSPYHFIEVMGCPGGCITGGGQPRTKDILDTRQKRMNALYHEDEHKQLRKAHENPTIQTFYREWGAPGGQASHTYLHTHYTPRGIYNELTDETFVLKK